jgi:hypothetical protein
LVLVIFDRWRSIRSLAFYSISLSLSIAIAVFRSLALFLSIAIAVFDRALFSIESAL